MNQDHMDPKPRPTSESAIPPRHDPQHGHPSSKAAAEAGNYAAEHHAGKHQHPHSGEPAPSDGSGGDSNQH